MADGNWYDDMDEAGGELTDEGLILKQDLHHILYEDYGSNLDVTNRGVGLLNRLNSHDSPADIASNIEFEFKKDDRVKDCKVLFEVSDDGAALIEALNIRVVAIDGIFPATNGSFDLAYSRVNGDFGGGTN